MQRLEVSCAVRPLYGSFGVKGLNRSSNEVRVLWLGSAGLGDIFGYF